MKKIVLVLSVIFAIITVSCTNNVNAAETTDLIENATMANGVVTNNNGGKSKMLVAYFSCTGEQYGVGVIEEGNTAVIAKMIAEKTGADLFEIKSVKTYPNTYNALIDDAKKEQNEKARPEIKDKLTNLVDYDTVFLGYPNWWGDMPMIIYTFLETYDLSGKIVIPFATHGGSGLSRTESTIKNITKTEMKKGFEISGVTAQKDRATAKSKVESWLKEIGYAN